MCFSSFTRHHESRQGFQPKQNQPKENHDRVCLVHIVDQDENLIEEKEKKRRTSIRIHRMIRLLIDQRTKN